MATEAKNEVNPGHVENVQRLPDDVLHLIGCAFDLPSDVFALARCSKSTWRLLYSELYIKDVKLMLELPGYNASEKLLDDNWQTFKPKNWHNSKVTGSAIHWAVGNGKCDIVKRAVAAARRYGKLREYLQLSSITHCKFSFAREAGSSGHLREPVFQWEEQATDSLLELACFLPNGRHGFGHENMEMIELLCSTELAPELPAGSTDCTLWQLQKKLRFLNYNRDMHEHLYPYRSFVPLGSLRDRVQPDRQRAIMTGLKHFATVLENTTYFHDDEEREEFRLAKHDDSLMVFAAVDDNTLGLLKLIVEKRRRQVEAASAVDDEAAGTSFRAAMCWSLLAAMNSLSRGVRTVAYLSREIALCEEGTSAEDVVVRGLESIGMPKARPHYGCKPIPYLWQYENHINTSSISWWIRWSHVWRSSSKSYRIPSWAAMVNNERIWWKLKFDRKGSDYDTSLCLEALWEE